MKGKTHTPLRKLQSLIGVLNFAFSVVVPGRAFLRRLIGLTCRVSKPHELIELTEETKQDIDTCQSFINEFNGKCVFLPQNGCRQITSLCILTPRCKGVCSHLGFEWFASFWFDELKQY